MMDTTTTLVIWSQRTNIRDESRNLQSAKEEETGDSNLLGGIDVQSPDMWHRKGK